MDYTYHAAQEAMQKYGTRDPYELLDALGADLHFSDNYAPDGLKGFAAIQKNSMYVVINGKLDEYEKRIVAGHEGSHLICHRQEILKSPAKALRDFTMYTNNGRLEYEANRFLANFLVSDEMVLDAISSRESDFLSTASVLCLPPELLAFKLYSMMERGLPVRNPVDLKSNFLR